jgi:hypothetical protein
MRTCTYYTVTNSLYAQAGDPAAGVSALDEGLNTDKLTHRMRVTFHTLKATLHMSRGDGTSAVDSYNAAAGV